MYFVEVEQEYLRMIREELDKIDEIVKKNGFNSMGLF
jgi:hypothetical protein